MVILNDMVMDLVRKSLSAGLSFCEVGNTECGFRIDGYCIQKSVKENRLTETKEMIVCPDGKI